MKYLAQSLALLGALTLAVPAPAQASDESPEAVQKAFDLAEDAHTDLLTPSARTASSPASSCGRRKPPRAAPCRSWSRSRPSGSMPTGTSSRSRSPRSRAARRATTRRPASSRSQLDARVDDDTTGGKTQVLDSDPPSAWRRRARWAFQALFVSAHQRSDSVVQAPRKKWRRKPFLADFIRHLPS